MKMFRLSALSLLAAGSFLMLSSCDRDDAEIENYYSATLTLKGANEIPANASTATGTAFVEYSRLNKTLTYTVNFSGLTNNIVAAHIHGVGDPANIIGVLHTMSIPSPASTAGTMRGSVFMDGVVMKENDLLNGKYYFNIHTLPTFGGGEIRAQILLK